MKELELREQVQEFVRSFGLLNQELTPCGQSLAPTQAHAIHVLGEAGPIALQALAARLNLDKSTASRLISHLVGRGWVERSENPADRRELRLRLTDAGQTLHANILGSSAARYRQVLDQIPPEKHAQVLEALALLTRAVREE